MSIEARLNKLENMVRVLFTRGSSSASGVTSFNTRTGDVVPATNDYSEAMLSFTDITTNNVSSTKHGFVKKFPNTTTTYLDGTGNYQSVNEAGIALTDLTTNDASTTKHGFLKKLDNSATNFMNGQGDWATPAGETDTDTYGLVAYAGNSALNDSTTYYCGSVYDTGWGTTADTKRVYVPTTGTITRVDIFWSDTAVTISNQQSTISLRLNNTTDNTLSTTLALSALGTLAVTGLSIAVSAGDYFEIKWATPVWTTNPAALKMAFAIKVQVQS